MSVSYDKKRQLIGKMIANPTEAEYELYRLLDSYHVKYYRQFFIAGYIVDAMLTDYPIAIEADGEYHNTDDQIEYDLKRTLAIKKLGVKVIRFSNDIIIKNSKKIAKRLKSEGVSIFAKEQIEFSPISENEFLRLKTMHKSRRLPKKMKHYTII